MIYVSSRGKTVTVDTIHCLVCRNQALTIYFLSASFCLLFVARKPDYLDYYDNTCKYIYRIHINQLNLLLE